MKKILFALILLLFALLPLQVSAQDVNVGLYVLNLGKFDIATGTFTADFYLSIKCNEECSPENFEFMNGRASSVDKILDEPTEKFYRIQANLNSPIDLKRFPFDSQKMEIVLEDKKNTIDQIRYVPLVDESGIEESIAFSGWKLDGWNAVVKEHDYKIYDETYSQYIFNIDISRIVFNAFLKTFLPVFFILLVVLFSFVLDPDKINTRLGMVGSSLVASVMFHVSISNQIPPVGYLTFADKFMVLTYFVLLSTFIINILMLELSELKKDHLVEKIHRKTEYSMFLVVPALYII
ncbi:hypothetical protein HY643_01650, partial [Candidatus Woesearchaeota archaeon]|nr:hypothetical protein [Candidatus Woesearchaeota archaeon]